MRKRIAIASLLLLAAVIAVALWSDRSTAHGRARSATGHEADATPHGREESAGLAARGDARPALSLHGRVLEEGTDTPVAGAAVTAYAFETARTLRTTSAGDGTFDFPDAAPAQVLQLVVRHEGFAAASLRAILSDDPVVVRLSPGGGIRGRVVSAENAAPVPECRVCAVRIQGWEEDWDVSEWLLRKLLPEELAMEAVATTRSDGGFEMAHVAPGAYVVVALVDGQVLGAARNAEVENRSTAEVEIRKPGTAPLFLDVIDQDTGESLDGARFEDIAYEGIAAPLPAQYRGDGIYEMRSDYRNWFHLLVRVSRNGYAPRILFVHGGWACHQRAALGRGAAIAGHVQTATGPLPQALVFVVAWNTLVGSAITGADGGFEITGLDAPESVIVYVLRPSLESIAELRLLLRAGERRALEIGGSGGAAIEGRVVLGGAPAHAGINIWGPCDSYTFTGPDRAYAFEGLDPGRYRVTIETGGQSVTRDVEVGKAQRVRLDVVLPCALSGMVVEAGTGAPVTDIKDRRVVVRRVDAPSEDDVTAEVGDDGRFRCHVEPAIYEIDCGSPEVRVVERPRVDLTRNTESGPVALRVERDPQDGRIVLDVKDARTGDPVPKGHWGGGWPEENKFVGERIEAAGLSLGPHRFCVWSDAHAPTTVEITLTPERKSVRQAILLQPSEAVRVGYIERGAPEAIAGLRRDDVILSFSSVAALQAALASARGAVAVEVDRAGERKTVTLPAGEIDVQLENILLGR